MSSSGAALPPLRPLRTGRASRPGTQLKPFRRLPLTGRRSMRRPIRRRCGPFCWRRVSRGLIRPPPSPSLLKGGPPGGVVGIGVRLHLGMPLEAATGGREQSGGDRRLVRSGDRAAEHPVPRADRVEVLPSHPACSLLGMAATRPRPQGREDGVVHSCVDARTGHMPMEERPASYDGLRRSINAPAETCLLVVMMARTLSKNAFVFLAEGVIRRVP